MPRSDDQVMTLNDWVGESTLDVIISLPILPYLAILHATSCLHQIETWAGSGGLWAEVLKGPYIISDSLINTVAPPSLTTFLLFPGWYSSCGWLWSRSRRSWVDEGHSSESRAIPRGGGVCVTLAKVSGEAPEEVHSGRKSILDGPGDDEGPRVRRKGRHLLVWNRHVRGKGCCNVIWCHLCRASIR